MDRVLVFAIIVIAAKVLVMPLPAQATTNDSKAPIVQLRTNCTEAGSALNNCFTSFSSLLPWIWGTRHPSINDPLLVEIGPGTFDVQTMLCNSAAGQVTFRGAGRESTTLTSSNESVIGVSNCGKLAFENLSIKGTTWGVEWSGGGESVWTNVELEAPSMAWYDSLNSGVCAAGQGGKHYWFSSTIRISRTGSVYPGVGVPAYYSICGESWFWGSEIANLNINTTSGAAGARRGILAVGAGTSVHFYGGNIRLVSDEVASPSQMIGVQVAQGASVHIHGTGIDVEATGDVPIVVLKAGPLLGFSSGGEIHANGASYSLRTGTGGTISRVNSDITGHIHAPYVWEHIPNTDGNPDTIDTNFTSANGADQTIVTVGTNDGHPHSAVYSSTCPLNARWYDQVDKLCRGK